MDTTWHALRVAAPGRESELECMVEGVGTVHASRLLQAVRNQGMEATVRTERVYHPESETATHMFILRAAPQHHHI
eukprot:8128598-Prorocentrum_lima.AAC.1